MVDTFFARFLAQANALFEAASASHRRAVLALAAACLLLFLPGFFSLQPMDRDEPRFAQATRQMLQTGDFVRIRFQDQARNNKPAGIYWAQAAAVSAGEALGVPEARKKIWLYRLPSLAGAIAAVLLTYWAALAFVSSGSALLAALLLASTVLLGVEARLGKTDAALLATIVAAMGAFARMYLGQGGDRRWRLPAIFWTAIGIGILLKGPITPLPPLLAGIMLLAVNRGAPWFGRMKFVPGVAWVLLIALPWFVLILIETQGAFLTESVGKDMLGKVASGKESHGAPPLTYFGAFWVTAWPMAPFAALAAPFVWRSRRTEPVLFLLAWTVPVWLLFELVPTKLPHYVLPVYPAIAILIALAVQTLREQMDAGWREKLLWLIPLVAVLVTGAGGGLAAYTAQWPGWEWFVFGAGAVGLAILAASGDVAPVPRVLASVLSAACLYWATYGGVLTSAPGRIVAISPRIAELAQSAASARCPAPRPATAGYYEPSLVLLTRTDLVMTGGKGAARHLTDAPCRIAFVELRQEGVFRAEIAGRDDIGLVGRVKGINLNGGKSLDIGVWLRQ